MDEPMRETEADRGNERRAVAAFVSRHPCCGDRPYSYTSFPVGSVVDGLLHRDSSVPCFYEVKCRNISRSTFKTLWVERSKLTKQITLMQMLNINTVWIFSLRDSILYLHATEILDMKLNAVIRRREDRGTVYDSDWVHEVPIKRFHLLPM